MLTINDTFTMAQHRYSQQALRWAQAQWAELERPTDAEAEQHARYTLPPQWPGPDFSDFCTWAEAFAPRGQMLTERQLEEAYLRCCTILEELVS